jgi:hypothetical protein
MNKPNLTQNRALGRGLYYLFLAEVLWLFSTLTLLGSILALVSAGVSIYALYTMSRNDTRYTTPFLLTFFHVLVTAAQSYAAVSGIEGTIVDLLPIVTQILKIIIVYMICKFTRDAIGRMDATLAERGAMAWKLYTVSYMFVIARELLLASDAPETLFTNAQVALLISAAVIISCVYYLYYLWGTQSLLQKK